MRGDGGGGSKLGRVGGWRGKHEQKGGHVAIYSSSICVFFISWPWFRRKSGISSFPLGFFKKLFFPENR